MVSVNQRASRAVQEPTSSLFAALHCICTPLIISAVFICVLWLLLSSVSSHNSNTTLRFLLHYLASPPDRPCSPGNPTRPLPAPCPCATRHRPCGLPLALLVCPFPHPSPSLSPLQRLSPFLLPSEANGGESPRYSPAARKEGRKASRLESFGNEERAK